MPVKSGDQVIVITGKDKGKKGRVLQAHPKTGRVLVEGVNLVKKHTRPSQANPQGGIVTQEAPIDVSNVMLVDPKTGGPTRVGYQVQNDQKVRVAKKSGAIIEK
ncbi:50S ribosomal protein L24 [Rubeoparvulum massiliense]|uniref:50S ribosomal protein L24 n=1 Tax=Rubeoparvulum massiliense TaxID=1631346 RepID=UPI00065E1D6C|nr:50S ribosomal protein L24 [Rubeoparvulum massiliense]